MGSFHQSGQKEQEAQWWPSYTPLMPLGLVLLGLLPRFTQYFHYRALFHDEAVLANNVATRPFVELFGPFGDSMAPTAYLVLTRCAIAFGGMNEYAARCVPFLGGLLSLIIFYPVAKRVVSPVGACIALAFFVVAKYIIEFSDYVRPYSTDVLVTLVLFGLATSLQGRKPAPWRYVVFAGAGALSVWLSFPAVIVLAGLGIAQIGGMAYEGNRSRTAQLCAVYIACAASFLALYFTSIRPISSDAQTMLLMHDYYRYAHAFMPLPPKTFDDLRWFNWHFIRVFENPGGLTLAALGAFAAVVGCVALFLNNRRNLALLLLPVAMALLVSGLAKYPFWARTILYLTPILYLLIGEGIAFLAEHLKGRAVIVAAIIFAMLIGVPAFRAVRMIREPSSHHELNKALDYAQGHWREGDRLYIEWASSAPIPFLRWRYDFADDAFIFEPSLQSFEEREAFLLEQLDGLKQHGRVWVPIVFDHPDSAKDYCAMWDRHATRTKESHALGASIYLYEFPQTGDVEDPN